MPEIESIHPLTLAIVNRATSLSALSKNFRLNNTLLNCPSLYGCTSIVSPALFTIHQNCAKQKAIVTVTVYNVIGELGGHADPCLWPADRSVHFASPCMAEQYSPGDRRWKLNCFKFKTADGNFGLRFMKDFNQFSLTYRKYII